MAKKSKTCAKCGTCTGKLNQCESGHICGTCLDAHRVGRDETTIAIRATKVVTLAGPQKPQPTEITVPACSPALTPAKPATASQQPLPDIISRDAFKHRTELLSYLGNECVAVALDLENTMKPANKVEQMLLDLMAVSYKASLETSSKGFLASDPADQTRLLNLSARMAENFQKAALTFQRLQSGGNQQIIVQHVHVSEGGQAIVGNVQTGSTA
jgi:hypothetical protein